MRRRVRTNLTIDGGEGWESTEQPDRALDEPGPGQRVADRRALGCTSARPERRTVETHDVGPRAVEPGVGGFDGPGDYTVRVSLKDQAGNHDPTALSNSVRLRFDNLAPGAAEPGVANGWLNAVERAAFQQHVKLDGRRRSSPCRASRATRSRRTAPTLTTRSRRLGDVVNYPINDLPEGVNTIKARAVSGAGVGVGTGQVGRGQGRPVRSRRPRSMGRPIPRGGRAGPSTSSFEGVDQVELSGMARCRPGPRPIEEGAYIAYKIDDGELAEGPRGTAPVTVADEGEHTVTYYAVDFAGNESETQDRAVQDRPHEPDGCGAPRTRSTRRPGSASRSPCRSPATTGRAARAWTRHPRASRSRTARELVYRLDAGTVQTARGGATTFKVDADGDHAVTYWAVDGAGNESESQEVRFRIDKTAPSPVVLEQLGADRRRLEVEAGDATSGVGEVQIGLRRVGSIGQTAALAGWPRSNPARYRRTKLRRHADRRQPPGRLPAQARRRPSGSA